jgi:hypothetical protein
MEVHMLAVYLNTPTGSWELLALALVIGILGAMSTLATSKVRKVALVVIVLAVAKTLYAAPYPLPCDPLWRWLGLC